MEIIFTFEYFINFITLTSIEIILGIDNIIFIAIVVQNFPKQSRDRIRILGLTLALIFRILMVFSISWIMSLNESLFYIWNFKASGRSLLLLIGGLFLIIKSSLEIKRMLSLPNTQIHTTNNIRKNKWLSIAQIIFVDLIFSFDSIIVAVAMIDNIYLIIGAIVIAMLIMIAVAKKIGEFIYQNPGIKVLGLVFIILIGLFLIANSFNLEVSKAYLYSAMLVSLIVELINIKLRNK